MGLGVRGRVDDGWRVLVSRLLSHGYGNVGLLAHLVHHLAARGRHATHFVGYDCHPTISRFEAAERGVSP